MMKKLMFLGAFAALLLGTASCANDMEPAMNGDEVMVQYTVSLGDGIDSRTISDGTGANTLLFAVYTESGQHLADLDQTVTVENKTATVTTKLARYHTYKLVFWAQNSACTAYTFDKDNGAINVDYTTVNCNDESRDAFYKMHVQAMENETVNETIVLTRPFAQINFLASDAAGVQGLDAYLSKVTVTGVPTQLNVLDGSVAEPTDVTFDYATLPNETLAGFETYKYVAMNYVLAAVDKELKNTVELTVNDGTQDVNTVTVSDCPVQRNYRTNIFGDLFTVEGNFNITIDPIYNGDIDVDMSATYYEANTSGALEDIMAQINTDQPEKAIVKVADGVTLTWQTGAAHGSTPLIDETNTKTKQLVFEGQGDNSTFEAQGAGVGPIRATNGATIVFKNMNIVDNSVSYTETNWEFTYLELSGNLKFEDCRIKDGIMLCGGTSNTNTDVDAEFVNCIFTSDTETSDSNPIPTNMYAVWMYNGNAKFTNCDFSGYRGMKVHQDYGSTIYGLTVESCYFHDITLKNGMEIDKVSEGAIFTFKNNTVKKTENCTMLYKATSNCKATIIDENNVVED